MTNKYTYEELNEAIELLMEMRDNCVRRETDTYNDPKRDAKYKALTIAISELDHLFWINNKK
ncbi:hypothetical protein CGS57_01435 [Faecalibacterium prausnitzii]|nr:hypothetical protein CGS53_01385 [Faecalibacterium prausnitzii]PDX79882.1 hypothetical protein CGS57_01435 [Faecalibacterium prausnitzii]